MRSRQHSKKDFGTLAESKIKNVNISLAGRPAVVFSATATRNSWHQSSTHFTMPFCSTHSSHKDPYKPASIMECHREFDQSSNCLFSRFKFSICLMNLHDMLGFAVGGWCLPFDLSKLIVSSTMWVKDMLQIFVKNSPLFGEGSHFD